MLNDRLLQFVNIDLHDVKVPYSENCYEIQKILVSNEVFA